MIPADTPRNAQPQNLDSLRSPQQADEESPLSPIIQALVPDIRERSRTPAVDPLPMAALKNGGGLSSIVYAICRIDDSGRFYDREIIDTADWHPGERLRIQLVHGVVAFIPSPHGPLTVTRRRRVAVPAHARQLLSLDTKAKALLAAAPVSRVVIVYPMSTLEEMITWFHQKHENDVS